VIAGDAKHAIKRLKALAKGGIDHVLLNLQSGGAPHEQVVRSIQLFGEEIIPALRDVTAAENGQMERGDMRVALREAGNVTPELLFDSMPLVFRRDRSDGLNALYQVDLEGDGGGTWWVNVADGDCQVMRDAPEGDVDVRIESDPETWLAIAKGERTQAGSLFRRRVKIHGNRIKAARFTRLFR
jgi:hypothetical protein